MRLHIPLKIPPRSEGESCFYKLQHFDRMLDAVVEVGNGCADVGQDPNIGDTEGNAAQQMPTKANTPKPMKTHFITFCACSSSRFARRS